MTSLMVSLYLLFYFYSMQFNKLSINTEWLKNNYGTKFASFMKTVTNPLPYIPKYL